MKILLVNMPFGAVRPAIGPSLLKAHLAGSGCETRIAYLNLRYAQLLGGTDFTYIADRSPTQSLAGDWVFAPALFGRREEADRRYRADFRERFGRFAPPEGPLACLDRARALVEPFLDECLEQVDWAGYDLIGFTSTFTQHVASLALAKRVKERHPEKVVVFGGANCEDRMGLALHRSFPFVDYVCGGEADISFPELVRTIRDGGDPATIPGVISRPGSTYPALAPQRVKDMDALPLPDYEDYFEQLALTGGGNRSILMECSRGCWWGEKHHCTFCGLNGTSMAFRSKSAARVLDEIDEQIRRYRSAHIEMVDNILDMHYFQDLLPELERRRLDLGLFFETKANLTKAQVRQLRAAGVTAIQPGIESFSSDVLHIMRKGATALQNIQLLKWCKEIGVKVYWNLLYGFPGEDPRDYETTARVIDSITHLDPPQGMGAIRLDRFSPNFMQAAELGLCGVRPDRSYAAIYDLPPESLADLAYYFEHDYVDGRVPAEYVVEAEAAMRRWFAQTGGRGLISVDHGDQLALWDFRAVAVRRLTVLEGGARDVYEHCDEHRSLAALTRYATGIGLPGPELRRILDELCEARLMLELDGRYLSLAVPVLSRTVDEAAQAETFALAF
ncbi:RiPP maturation radical SAM C-methyltransferase [Hamadaea tsunoensis]|uniref:RiPP maturation radical SAM C-methyltransferase n=1 Tax=Hamadaea tsunoensis TaxID=53368 RepID=UPI0004137900|nr:RiPP maturation radical SAM C-methyltransferase [Hamadaea tsunoensis]